VEVAFCLRNVGLDSGSSWNATLTCSHPGIAISVPQGVVPAIAAGMTGCSTPFAIEISPSIPDGTIASFLLTGTGPSGFSETFAFVVESPRLELERFEISGDVLVPRIANRGTAGVGDIVATLEPVSGDAVVLDGTTTTAWIHPGQSLMVGEGFRVGGPASAKFLLTISGAQCAPVSSIVDRTPPDGPRSLVAEPLDEGARISWLRSDSEDVVGYRVFTRTPGGAWSPAEGQFVREGAFALVDLPPATTRDALVLAVDASGNASADSLVGPLSSAPRTLPGWPQSLSSVVGPSALVAADLDGDGMREILVGSMWDANAVHVFRADGSEWTDGDQDPKTNGIFGKTQGRVNAAPLAVDVDGDGSCEIFAPSYDGFVHAWRTNGAPGTPPPVLPGWPVDHGENGSRTSPVAGDLDGDGALEIVTVSNDGKIRALESNGAMMAGWPRTTRQRGLGSTPAIADLDGDGKDDVVVGATDSTLYACSGTGADLPGWPLAVGDKIVSSPVLADVDGDGDLEIFVFDRAGRFWAFHHDDEDAVPGPDPLPGWPVAIAPLSIAPPSPAVADFDGDGTPEIVVNGAEGIVILRADGTRFGGAPIATGSTAANSPIVADLDGDGSLDLLVGLMDRRLLAVHPNGAPLEGWPRSFIEVPSTTPAVADVDGDGMLDVVVGADDATIRVLALPTPDVDGVAPWPCYHGGTDLRGVYVAGLPAPIGADPLVALPPALALAPARPNPFRTSTTISFVIPAAARIDLEVYEVTGRRITQLVAGRRMDAGAHHIAWDGRDASGRLIATGMYFVRLTAGRDVATARLLRVR
jgi:hypothetical protein